jgi:hypothetical protein
MSRMSAMRPNMQGNRRAALTLESKKARAGGASVDGRLSPRLAMR